ncbi:hypothetical protein F2Q69_00050096 [Brassica cretica]|uniref:Transmembrane protein n=1 Tax=Brassica cretica TaxID=69181 RepID=A0A8S9PYA6_BRACR|nr:hypothetical protein F2Q69_00050096 [Brassica cretica]
MEKEKEEKEEEKREGTVTTGWVWRISLVPSEVASVGFLGCFVLGFFGLVCASWVSRSCRNRSF